MQNYQLNILLADDDMDDCSFFKEALEALPISTHLKMVHDGDQLMKHLTGDSEQLPDVVFLDINMPRKNGMECLTEMKKDVNLRSLPVIMFSTSNSMDKINLLFRYGASVYIHKPSDFGQLKEILSHALPIATEQAQARSQVKYILNA
jgi:DNA-binding NtrC family response regulator